MVVRESCGAGETKKTESLRAGQKIKEQVRFEDNTLRRKRLQEKGIAADKYSFFDNVSTEN